MVRVNQLLYLLFSTSPTMSITYSLEGLLYQWHRYHFCPHWSTSWLTTLTDLTCSTILYYIFEYARPVVALYLWFLWFPGGQQLVRHGPGLALLHGTVVVKLAVHTHVCLLLNFPLASKHDTATPHCRRRQLSLPSLLYFPLGLWPSLSHLF